MPHMYYKNFDENITAKYGVVIDGWPLERFCNPSNIASRTEISVLRSSFESGTTRFRLLTQPELDTWSETQFQAAVMTGPVASTTPTPTSTPQQPAEPHDENMNLGISSANSVSVESGTSICDNVSDRLPLTASFINFGVTSTDGTPTIISKKPRKERSDKGKKRGKRTKPAS